VLDDIDLGGPADAEDDDERIAIGRLLKEAGKLALRRRQPVQARRRFEEAESFFSSVQCLSGFACTQYGDVLLCLGRAAEAGQVLDQAPEHQREAFWLLRRSEAHLAVGDVERALDRINEALARPDLDERRPTFLAHRAEVLFREENPAHLTSLEEALSICAEGRYRDELQKRLNLRRVSSVDAARVKCRE
jgi:tetratricopeptide (TPR) repeat protein